MAQFHGYLPAKAPPYRVTSTETEVSDPPKSTREVSISPEGYRFRQSQSYKPFAHRTIYFALIGILVLGLIGALEYSVHVLPQGSFDLNVKSEIASHLAPSKRREKDVIRVKRQVLGADPTSSPTPDLTPIGPGDLSVDAAAATTTKQSTLQTAPSAYGSGGAATTIIAPSATPSSAYASGGSATTIVVPLSTPSSVVTTVQPAPSNTLTAPVVLTTQVTYQTVQTVVASGTGSARTTQTVTKGNNDPTKGYLESDQPLAVVDQPHNYFLGVYAPVLIALIIHFLVAYLYNCTRLMDPFDMLTRDGGVPLKDFFWTEFLGSTSPLAPMRTLLHRRWTLLWTSTIYGATQLLIPFASELVAIHPSYHNVVDSSSNVNKIIRGRSLWVNPVLVRIIQALLAFIFIQLINVRLLLRHNKSSLRCNPASISAMASVMSHPEVAHDLMYIDQYKKPKAAIERVSERRYRLQYYIGPDGSECYGLVPTEGSCRESSSYPRRSTIPLSPRGSSKASKSALRTDSMGLAMVTLSALTLFGIILAYFLNHDSTPFEHFMDSQSFGPRFMLATLALILKSPLTSLWGRTTASLPFARLAAQPRHARLDVISPVPVYRTPLGSLGYTLRRCEWFATYLGLMAGIVVEILLILLPGVPFQSQQFYNAARASWFGSLACLALILLGALGGWVRLILNRAEWPQVPNSLGAIGLYVAGTALAADCAAVDSVLPPGATFEFKRRGGRWLVDYSTVGDPPFA